tara:strand:+ start:447 stop:632 length:186 start_codon:yes stop_codon:yes gene_type:complete
MRDEYKQITELSRENSELKEKIKEAIKICSQYNWHDEISMRWALDRLKNFLESNEKSSADE